MFRFFIGYIVLSTKNIGLQSHGLSHFELSKSIVETNVSVIMIYCYKLTAKYAGLLSNGNIECVINVCKYNSLCGGQSQLASMLILEYYLRYFTFGNALKTVQIYNSVKTLHILEVITVLTLCLINVIRK